MGAKRIFAIILGILLIGFLVYFGFKFNESGKVVSEPKPTSRPDIPKKIQNPSETKYFSSSSDRIVISASSKNLNTDNPTTKLTYYAVDKSNKIVKFKEEERAFVRILGISHVFSNNTEIFHPEKYDGTKDDTLFSGDITFPGEGVYLIKVCLGKSINLDSEGNNIWPFGCFEDDTSIQVNVYKR